MFPLVKHGLQVCLEHDGHEVAAAAADVDGEVPDAQFPVQHNPLLRGAQPVRHLKFSVPLIRFESYLKTGFSSADKYFNESFASLKAQFLSISLLLFIRFQSFHHGIMGRRFPDGGLLRYRK